MFGNDGFFNNGATGAIVRDFTSSGSWTKPAGLTCATFIVIGSGGGGGGGAGVNNTIPRYQASGGAGGGGGGLVCITCSAASITNSPWCMCIRAAGAGGAGTSTPATNGTIGTIGGAVNAYDCTGATIANAGGGGPGGGGCYCPNTTSCIVVAGGAGGTGTTYAGNGGGSAVFKYQDIFTSNSACTGNGPRGGGSGGGVDIGSGNPGAGGAACCYIGLRLGKGGDQCGGVPFLPGSAYGAGGGGGNACIISGTVTKATDGGAGASGIVRVIEYYS